MNGPYLIVSEAAEITRTSLRTVYALAAEGRIPHRKIGGMRRLLFREDELRAWLDGADLETIETVGGGRIVRPIEPGA